MLREIWRWLECENFGKNGEWSCFCYVESSHQWLPLQCKRFVLNISGVVFGRSEFISFDILENISFMLPSTVQFNFWKFFEFQETLCDYVARNMGQFTYPNCRVASSLWCAHFDLRICGGAQLSGRPHPVDYTSILLIFQDDLDWSKVLYWR